MGDEIVLGVQIRTGKACQNIIEDEKEEAD